jgi:DNA-binding transcriptional LysR family regulator
MEVRQLEIFCSLATQLNFTRTAEQVNTVQSNVTTQIKALEQELGAPLFDRLAKHVVLTEAGRRFLPYAERALAAMGEGHRAVQFGSEPAGPLRIGSPESVLTYRLPRVLERFRKRYPKVELQFRPYWHLALAAALESGTLDIAICMDDRLDCAALKSERLGTEKILLLAHPRHPFLEKKAVRPDDLAGQALLLTETGCGYRRKLDETLKALNIKPESVTEFNSVEAIKQCLIADMGLALLPEIVVAKEIKDGQFAPVRWEGPRLDISTHILWHKDKWISPAMAAFLDTMKRAS